MHDVAAAFTRLVFSVLLALPFAGDWVARLLGWHIFFLADGTMQFLWATGLVLAGAWGYHVHTVRSVLNGELSEDGAISAAALLLYGYSVWVTFGGAGLPGRTGLHYETLAMILVLLNLGRLLEAVLVTRILGDDGFSPGASGLDRAPRRAVRYGGLLALLVAALAAAIRVPAWEASEAVEKALLMAVAVLLAVRPGAALVASLGPLRAAVRAAAAHGIRLSGDEALVTARELRALVLRQHSLMRPGAAAEVEERPEEGVRKVAVRAVSELEALGVQVAMVAEAANPLSGTVSRLTGAAQVLQTPSDEGDLSGHLSTFRARTGGGAVALLSDRSEHVRTQAAADLILLVPPAEPLPGSGHMVRLAADDLRSVPQLVRLSRAAFRARWAGMALVLVYHVMVLALAALGLLRPVIAMGLASLAGVAGVAFSLRMARFDPR